MASLKIHLPDEALCKVNTVKVVELGNARGVGVIGDADKQILFKQVN